jgi:tRNA(His) guanylyltransferase
MSKHCKIMQRIKAFYESRSRTFLTRRIPVIMRLDGKAFHTYTRGLDKPFDEGLIEDMQETTKYLCKNIQGAKCAYVQSDEISILITDYDKLGTDAWFDYNVQKMTSISASLATGIFNQIRTIRALKEFSEDGGWGALIDACDFIDSSVTLANFDSRVFNIPKEEVPNYFLARQKDAVKNSISMLAQSLYSHKELDKKNSNELQEMCFQKGHNWNDLHFSKKRGSFIVKNTYVNNELCEGQILKSSDGNYLKGIKVIQNSVIRTKWEVVETPFTFTNSNFQQWL